MQITVGISHFYCIIVGIYHSSGCQSNNLAEIWRVILVISPSGRQLFVGNATQSLPQASRSPYWRLQHAPQRPTQEKNKEKLRWSTEGWWWRRQRRVKQQANGEKIKTRQQTVPLPEHLGERGVAVIWPGGRRGAGQGRAGRGEERVNHTEGETGLLEGCDWKRVWAASRRAVNQWSLSSDYGRFLWTHRIAWPPQMIKSCLL